MGTIAVFAVIFIVALLVTALFNGKEEEEMESRTEAMNRLKGNLTGDTNANSLISTDDPTSIASNTLNIKVDNENDPWFYNLSQEYIADEIVDQHSENEEESFQETIELFKSDVGSFKATQEYIEESKKKSILIDEKNKQIAFITLGYDLVEVFAYKDILKAEIIEDGKTVTSTARGSQIGGALIGGVLAGGVGAVVGGLSGKTSSQKEIQKLDLKIVVNDSVNPVRVINFMGEKLYETSLKPPFRKGNDPVLIKAKKQIEHWHILLSVLINHDDEKNINSKEVTSVADELLKLSELMKQGILSEDEFNLQKEKLLRI